MYSIPKVISTVAFITLLLLAFECLALGTIQAQAAWRKEPSSDGVYYDSIHEIKRYLRENGWVSELVDDDQLEYELLLLEQLSSTTDHVPASLAIAQAAQESRFNPNAENNGAIGIMQIIPNYHQQTLNDICEEPTFDKWYEPRYNIAVGLSYMDELLGDDYACGDKTYALMMYNQGPASGTKTHLARGVVSDYASTIITLKNELDEIIEKGGTSNGTAS